QVPAVSPAGRVGAAGGTGTTPQILSILRLNNVPRHHKTKKLRVLIFFLRWRRRDKGWVTFRFAIRLPGAGPRGSYGGGAPPHRWRSTTCRCRNTRCSPSARRHRRGNFG